MELLRLVRRMYSLDTLDTRFTTSSRSPARRVVVDPSKPQASEKDSNLRRQDGNGEVRATSGASPSRWNTPEFYVYYIVFIVAVPLMFKTVYDVSKPSHPNYTKYEELLSPGWILGRKVDNSDAQYSSFRENVPYMLLLLVLHPLLRKLYNRAFASTISERTPNGNKTDSQVMPFTSSSAADARLEQRVSFDFYFAITLSIALHGFSAAKVFLILYSNFMLAKCVPKAYIPAATWIFNIGILFLNEIFHGYPYAVIAKSILPWPNSSDEDSVQIRNWGTFLDAYGGLLPRWEILFNLTVLRLISFNMDYYWSLGKGSFEIKTDDPKKKQLDPSNLSERDRVDFPARSQDYSFRNYVAYILYSPLYVAGPIITFNDYISQQRYISPSITPSRTLLYGIRSLICLLTMELMLHFIYAVAISKAQPAWEVYTPFQLSMLGYFNLHIIWLKLLLPWRFFRLWALIDGIDPPENMVRCMSDNYSTLAFWRGWHRSFNRWIVRYIYIPLGGSGTPGGSNGRSYWAQTRAIFNFLAVFTFVALWHDINLKLLMWGWLVTLFVLPEVIAGYLFPKWKWEGRKDAYRVICGVGAVGNILMLMAANLVGFAVGLDGLRGLVHGIVGSYSGLVFLASACAALFVGVQVMFETRQEELRNGIRMTC